MLYLCMFVSFVYVCVVFMQMLCTCCVFVVYLWFVVTCVTVCNSFVNCCDLQVTVLWLFHDVFETVWNMFGVWCFKMFETVWNICWNVLKRLETRFSVGNALISFGGKFWNCFEMIWNNFEMVWNMLRLIRSALNYFETCFESIYNRLWLVVTFWWLCETLWNCLRLFVNYDVWVWWLL